MTRTPLLALLCIVAANPFFTRGWAQSLSESEAASQCRQLATMDFSGVQDAPAQVTEAMVVDASDELPSRCEVTGYVMPNVGIALLLPVNWNGKFLHAGCGAFCGAIFKSACDEALRKGYACAVNDMGHKSSIVDGKWAYNNLQAEVDFGFRATHVSTVAGKAITEHYYGRAPRKSYFTGCSTGGRQALVAAQRFPWDFDGIVAMDPAINFSEIHVTMLWNYTLTRDKEGKPVFSDADIRTLQEAVIRKCDLNDGLKDGLIGDPRDCTFDPAELTCRAGANSSCLSPSQVEAAKKIYDGPRTSTGQKIAKGGTMLGAEDGGAMSNYQRGSVPLEFFRYAGFMPDPGVAWTPADFDFDRDYKRLGMMESLYAAANPDLRKFKQRGGKLLLTQGWHDAGAPFAFNTIDYYETAERTMGGRAATQEFFRLFTVPGRDHCGTGNGAWAIDHLSYLEAWVERDAAPDMLMSYHPTNAQGRSVKFPLADSDVRFSRPVYPYPIRTKYKGRGDPNKAENFVPVERR